MDRLGIRTALSPQDDFTLCQIAGLTDNRRELLKKHLIQKLDVPVFGPTHQFRKEKAVSRITMSPDTILVLLTSVIIREGRPHIVMSSSGTKSMEVLTESEEDRECSLLYMKIQ